MAVATPTTISGAPTRHRFTVDEWDELGRLGFFHEEARVELVDGEIIDMAPIGDPHAACVDRLTRLAVIRTDGLAIVRVQGPIRPSRYSEPQPDLALLAPRDDFYASGKPGPTEVLLVVEVADSTLAFDRGRKGPVYAAAGIPEYWIVNVNGAVVEVLTDPGPDGYRTSTTARPGDTLAPRSLPQVALTVAEILGTDVPDRRR
ncbi:MAG TPA: Uma2 family endonuclease [Acidimicrobiales bacterium]|jgi:Uma2 family endonuclease|nr:Uma2 family endonuclease [Acidimicrobiales bacterium]